MSERWVPVFGYEGIYEVSDMGRVKSLSRKVRCYGGNRKLVTRSRILSPGVNPKTGYKLVVLSAENIHRTFNVHRLVLENFTPRVDWKEQVNHKNMVKKDCRLENLEWCNRSENMRHAVRAGGYQKSREILCLTTGDIFPSISFAARFVGGGHTGIIRACTTGKTYHNHLFSYKEESHV